MKIKGSGWIKNPAKKFEETRKAIKNDHPKGYKIANHIVHGCTAIAGAAVKVGVFASTGNPILASSAGTAVTNLADGTKAALNGAVVGAIEGVILSPKP